MSDRSMIKMVHADGFFSSEGANEYCQFVKNLHFTQKHYGEELENFNMILDGMEPVFSRAIGERIVIDPERSGIFRKPMNNIIHFEDFSSLNEWCFIVALEQTTLNLWHHISEHGRGELSPIDAETALDGIDFNYYNLFEWIIHTNIVLKPGQGAFIRPWVFRSLDNGLIQYYRLRSDKKFRVLVMGLPQSSRSEVAVKLTEMFSSSVLLKSSTIREQEKDIDYSEDGQLRQSYRILDLARNQQEDVVVIDMTCPLERMREIINPDVIVWVNDTQDVDEEFVQPRFFDVIGTKIDDSFYEELKLKIESKRI